MHRGEYEFTGKVNDSKINWLCNVKFALCVLKHSFWQIADTYQWGKSVQFDMFWGFEQKQCLVEAGHGWMNID